MKKNNKIINTLVISKTLKNIFINLMSPEYTTLFFYNAGMAGFDGKQKKTKMALQSVIYDVIRKLKNQKIWTLNLFLKNTGRGSRRIIKLLLKAKIKIKRIKDISTFAHNGCRPSNKKRL